MLTIDPVAIGALAVQLAKVDAAYEAMSDAIDVLEAAANASSRNPGKEPARQACVEVLHAARDEYDDAQMDLTEAVREALYGPDLEDDE
jgi:hypothetical protein